MNTDGPVLIVETAGARLAFDARDVRGVRGVPQVTPLPRSPAPLLGVFHHEGNVLPLYDLIALADGDPRTQRPRVVIVHADGHELGLLVEDVLEVLPLPNIVVGPEDPALPPAIARIVEGRLRIGPAQEVGPAQEDSPEASERPGPGDGTSAAPQADDPELRQRLEEILEGAPEWLRRIHLQDKEEREHTLHQRAQHTLESDPGVHRVHMDRLVKALRGTITAPTGGVPA